MILATGKVNVDVLGEGEHTFTIAKDAASEHIDAAPPIRICIPCLQHSGALIQDSKVYQKFRNNLEK